MLSKRYDLLLKFTILFLKSTLNDSINASNFATLI